MMWAEIFTCGIYDVFDSIVATRRAIAKQRPRFDSTCQMSLEISFHEVLTLVGAGYTEIGI